VTWSTSVPILVFLGLSVLDLGPMYATEVRRRTDIRRASSLNASYRVGGCGRGHNKHQVSIYKWLYLTMLSMRYRHLRRVGVLVDKSIDQSIKIVMYRKLI